MTQLEVLVASVDTVQKAQKTLGSTELIVPDDILLNAKQKLSEALHMDQKNTYAVR